MTHAPLIHPLPHPIDLLALQQHDPVRFPLLMESTASGTAQGRWSLLLAAQGDVLRLDADGQVRDQHDAVQPGTFLQALDRAWQAERLPHDGSHSLPFRGGWALMLDYEVASQIEPVLPARARDDGRPTALALRCPRPIRANVLKLIAEAGKPVKAYELLEWVRNGKGVGADAPPTVYRALDFLMANGFVHKLESVNAFVACHHPSSAAHSVPFLICNSCHSAVELEDREIVTQLEKRAKELGFQPQAQTLEVHGLCARCAG